MQYCVHHAGHPLWFEFHDKWKGRVECHFIFRNYLFVALFRLSGWYQRAAPDYVAHTISDVYLLLLLVIVSKFLHFGGVSFLEWILVSFDCIFRIKSRNWFPFRMKMNLFLEIGITTIAVFLGPPLRFTLTYPNFMIIAQEAAQLWAHQSYLAYRVYSYR